MLQSILALLGMIFVNAFFAATEIAILSINETKMTIRAEEGDKKAAAILKIANSPDNFLGTIQIGVSLTTLFFGIYASEAFSAPITNFLINNLNLGIAQGTLRIVVIILLTLLLSFFMMVLGELVPKRIAMEKAEVLSGIVVHPIQFVSVLATPFVKIISAVTGGILKILGVESNASNDDVTEEELRLLVSEGGLIEEKEKEYIDNIFEFNDKTAEDICTHRKDIISLPVDADNDLIIKTCINAKYSRIPVYKDSIDDIVGILYIRDLFYYIFQDGNIGKEINLTELLRKPYFVPSSKSGDELFEEMQKAKVHLAIVVDEYGGTAGIVSMEDLIEEIMGNILDEYDEEEAQEIEDIDESTFRILGSTPLSEIAEKFKIRLPIDDYETLSGFIISQIGHIPENDEKPEITFENLSIKVNEVLNKRIQSVIIHVMDMEDGEEDISGKI